MPEELEEPVTEPIETDPQEEKLRAIEKRASEIARLIREKNVYKERKDDLDAQKMVAKLETEIDTTLAKDGLDVVADKIMTAEAESVLKAEIVKE